MSLLKVNAVSDVLGTQQGNVADIVRGYAKAWVRFNGTGTVAIGAQFNVSSITDNGAGDYTVNFTNPLVDGNYCSFVTGGNSAGAPSIAGQRDASLAPSASQLRIYVLNTGGSGVDQAVVNVGVFR